MCPAFSVAAPLNTANRGFQHDCAASTAFANDEEPKTTALLIEGPPLIRDCLAHCIRRAYDFDVLTVGTVEQGLAELSAGFVEIAILIVDGPVCSDDNLQRIRRLLVGCGSVPLTIMADGAELVEVVRIMKTGARGFISTNMPLDVAVEAIRLVLAGGQFLPADCVLQGDGLLGGRELQERVQAVLHRVFTSRQAAVVEALRRGMANKVIAYELNMQESTVKVHVRNIMKKLKARNRTEVAYLANKMFD